MAHTPNDQIAGNLINSIKYLLLLFLHIQN